jgi:two-component system cell cycle response regulator
MGTKPVRVLVVQDAKSNLHDSLDNENLEVQVVRPEQLEKAIRDSRGDPQVVLLSAANTSKQLVVELKRIRAVDPNVPVLIVPSTSADHESTDGTVTRTSDKKLDAKKLADVVRRSMRQHGLRPELAHLALMDDLTGLYNRQGFLIFGSERMKMANSLKKNLLVFFADISNLKEINERFGIQEGDRALVKTGEIFRKTFRNSDLTSRFGGDEFTALVVEDADQSADSMIQRLQENMAQLEVTENDYQLSLSIGMTRYVAETRASLKRLLAQAARSQNEQLRAKRAEGTAKMVLTFPMQSRKTSGRQENSWQARPRNGQKLSGGES